MIHLLRLPLTYTFIRSSSARKNRKSVIRIWPTVKQFPVIHPFTYPQIHFFFFLSLTIMQPSLMWSTFLSRGSSDGYFMGPNFFFRKEDLVPGSAMKSRAVTAKCPEYRYLVFHITLHPSRLDVSLEPRNILKTWTAIRTRSFCSGSLQLVSFYQSNKSVELGDIRGQEA